MIKNIYTAGHFELYLFKVSGVVYCPSHSEFGLELKLHSYNHVKNCTVRQRTS
jgi:hypothetical protein